MSRFKLAINSEMIWINGLTGDSEMSRSKFSILDNSRSLLLELLSKPI